MSNKEIKVLYVSLPYTGHEKTMTNNSLNMASAITELN